MERIEKFGPAVAVVVVVDVQNDFCHPDGVMGNGGADVSAAERMVPVLQDFIEAARRQGVPVVWVRTTHDDTTNSAVWLARHSMSLRTNAPPPSNCWTDTWGGEFYKLTPLPSEPVVTKHRYSAFAGTTLNWVLRGLERRSLLVAGVSTEACVESTIRDGLFHDYHVTLVEDCAAAYTRADHDAAVRNVRNLFGLVATSELIVRQWEADADHV